MKYKKLIKYLLFVALTIGLMFLYSFTSKRNLQKKVHEIQVEFSDGDNNFLTHAMVNKLLIQKNDSIQNLPKSVINLYGLENNVLQNPYVEEAAVFLTIEGTLKTSVKQRSPIARIVNKNDSYYIDKQGIKIPLSDNYSARVLLVSGVEKDSEIKELVSLVSLILNDAFLKKEIVGIEKYGHNEYQFSTRSGNHKIDFGEFMNVAIKINKLKAFYNIAFEDKTIENYKKITVKYHNQVVCTK
ncbi:cell division protein FtsQ/DivIB [Polaribacter sp.]|uniref:cell division protein FtsQ/DivIB n=1 Tax=Polaribacter sp. TaxID=1920175 RepID=UPI003EF47B94